MTGSDDLVTRALEAREAAYAPYSAYAVGCAVLTSSGSVFSGCNVEISSYGLTMCAERLAVFSAVAAGERRIDRLVLATADQGTPCGACLQVISDFGTPETEVTLTDETARTKNLKLKDLLPMPFVRSCP